MHKQEYLTLFYGLFLIREDPLDDWFELVKKTTWWGSLRPHTQAQSLQQHRQTERPGQTGGITVTVIPPR